MKNKSLSLKLILVALLAVIAVISVCVFTKISVRAEGVEFTYADNEKTVLTGVELNGEKSVEIPETVKTIKASVFSNKDIETVEFAEGSSLETIENFAFAKTNITKLELPARVKTIGAGAFAQCGSLVYVSFAGNSVEEIGQAAFGNCASLNYIKLPENAAEINFGKYFVNNGDKTVYLIASDSEHYASLMAAVDGSNLEEYKDGVTYEVTITYNAGDSELARETRLYGFGYDVKFIDGKWSKEATEQVGPSSLSGMRWFYNGEGVTVDTLTKLLTDGSLKGDVIDMFVTGNSKKTFEARKDITYIEGKTYGTYEINDLLSTSSDKVNAGMKIEITGYKTPDGAEGIIPEVIGNAGEYALSITVAQDVYPLTVEIRQQVVDLSDYNSLSWRLDGQTELRNMNLYLYEKTEGGRYPSTSIISNGQLDELGLTGRYSNEYVSYSVARYNKGEELSIAVKDNPAYTVSYENGEIPSATEVGEYKANATVAVKNSNYIFSDRPASELRGLKIDVSADGRSAEITKTWYVVNVSNWLVTVEGGDINYTIKDFQFGTQEFSVTVPRLKYVHYDTANPVEPSFTLYLNGRELVTFTSRSFDRYINETMPVGAYTLVVNVGELESREYNDQGAVTGSEYHAGFTETFNFNVTKRSFNESLKDFQSSLNGKTFTYEWDGDSHFFDKTQQDAFAAFVDSFSNPVPKGIWAGAEFKDYYGAPTITYNLERMLSSEYTANVSTNGVDTYKVYYKVSAPNYFDSVESLDGNDSRTNYYFTVINVKAISLPEIGHKIYNGSVLTADVILPLDADGNPMYYTVIINDGGTEAGTYDVYLTLVDPVHYMWEGQTVEDKTEAVKVSFTIDKCHENYFSTTLGVTTWVAGKYGELEQFPVAAEAYFGSVIFKLTSADDIENVIYEGVNGTEEFADVLSGLKAGTYILTASVADSANFNGINDIITFRVYEKDGLAWWAVLLIVVGALGIAALILFILHQKGVLQMLTGKVVIAMRTKATVDATIAAVRANKVAAEAKKTVAKAEARDRMEALRAARAEAKNMSAEEQAAALEEKAAAAAKSAEKMQKRAENIQKKADRLKQTAAAEQTVTADPQPAEINAQPVEQPAEEQSVNEQPVEQPAEINEQPDGENE